MRLPNESQSLQVTSCLVGCICVLCQNRQTPGKRPVLAVYRFKKTCPSLLAEAQTGTTKGLGSKGDTGIPKRPCHKVTETWKTKGESRLPSPPLQHHWLTTALVSHWTIIHAEPGPMPMMRTLPILKFLSIAVAVATWQTQINAELLHICKTMPVLFYPRFVQVGIFCFPEKVYPVYLYGVLAVNLSIWGLHRWGAQCLQLLSTVSRIFAAAVSWWGSTLV